MKNIVEIKYSVFYSTSMLSTSPTSIREAEVSKSMLSTSPTSIREAEVSKSFNS